VGVVPRTTESRKSLRGISATDSVMRLLADLKVGNADSGFILQEPATASLTQTD